MKNKKSYYIPGFESPPHQLVETPASKERTDRNRFIITVVISAVAAVAAIIAAVVALVQVI